MEKLIFSVLVLCVVVTANKRHHPKFPHSVVELGAEVTRFEKVQCNKDAQREHRRRELIEEARCGPPRDVFVQLHKKINEQVSPSAVWVKRCVGVCDAHGDDSSCQPLDIVIRDIPVRILSLKTGKESCSTYQVEEHVSCGCSCPLGSEDCVSPRVHNPPEYEVE